MKKQYRNDSGLIALTAMLLSLGATGSLGCTREDRNAGLPSSDPMALAQSALSDPEAAAVAKTLAPLRALEIPGGVYIKSLEETFSATGNFEQTFHVYQPDGNGEPIRFELAAKTSIGSVDTTHSFQTVTLVTHPGESDELQQSLGNANGQVVYNLVASQSGWYRLTFSYGARNAGRTLSFRAYDAAGNALKTYWSDPPSASVQVRAKLAVEQATYAYLKGGAYRNTNASDYSYADYVKVDGNLLYRRGFDQGQFNFPLGYLTAAEHTVEFSLSANSYNTAKFWFGVNASSFDPNSVKTSWAPVQFLYYGAMHTGDYDAWREGVAIAQGASLAQGVRPPPVRRGTTFSVAVEHASLGGVGMNAILRVYPAGSGSEVTWAKSLPADYDYKGGIYTSSGLSPRYREHWRVTVPTNAPVGRYVVRAVAPNGSIIGSDVMFYVVYDPYTLVTRGAISKPVLDTYGYDEDEDGTNVNAAYGTDQDNLRDHFTAHMWGDATNGYWMRAKITGAFRRTQEESNYSLLDYAMAAADGTSSEFETMRRLYRIVNQRIIYNNPDRGDDTGLFFIADGTSFVPTDAYAYSRQGTELPREKMIGGECFDFGTSLAAIARSVGILSRAVACDGWLGGWGNHVFTEAYMPNLPLHGGKTTNSVTSPNSDTDPWYAFDTTDPNGNHDTALWTTTSEAIAPRSQYGKVAYALLGPGGLYPISARTNSLSWNPLAGFDVTAADVLDVSSAYEQGPNYWLTTSGVTGWLGFGEKDIYRISKSVSRAKAVRVRTLPNGGENLIPKLCIGSGTTLPSVPERCANAASRQDLPAGDSVVIVFNDSADVPRVRGDSIQYVLELEY